MLVEILLSKYILRNSYDNNNHTHQYYHHNNNNYPFSIIVITILVLPPNKFMYSSQIASLVHPSFSLPNPFVDG